MKYPDYNDLARTGVDLRRTVSYMNMGGKGTKDLKEGRMARNREVYRSVKKYKQR